MREKSGGCQFKTIYTKYGNHCFHNDCFSAQGGMFSLLVHSFKHHCFPSWTFELWLSRLKKNLLTMSDYQHIANRLWSVLCLLISSLSLSSLDITSGKRDISQYCYTYQNKICTGEHKVWTSCHNY